MMLLTHIIKTVEYFMIEGFPTITPDMIPEVIQALIFNTMKLATIYFAML